MKQLQNNLTLSSKGILEELKNVKNVLYINH